MEPVSDSKEFGKAVYRGLMENYLTPLYKEVQANPELVKTVPGFLLSPEKVVIYIGTTHIGVEYIGSEELEILPTGPQALEMQVFDYSQEDGPLLNKIIGFDYSDNPTPTPLPRYSDDLIVPTNDAIDALNSKKWDYSAQSMIFAINSGGMEPQKDTFSRIVNAKFFESKKGDLLTRYVKWMDFLPIIIEDNDALTDKFSIWFGPLPKLVEADARTPFPRPKDIRFGRLTRLNDFVELISDSSNSEPIITNFLAKPEYQFILKMRFASQEVLPEKKCLWQSETDRKPIKPDFFSVGADNFAEIMEFKLPIIKGSPVTGIENRERFSAEISSHIAQTRVYAEYFDDPNNRSWVNEEYGFETYKPQRTIVIGRRTDISTMDFKKLEKDFDDLRILTYDDIIDGIRGMLY